jgi:hypothetical protein
VDLIPDGITRKHILKAIEDYEGGAPHGFAGSTTYDVVFEGRRYPPRALIGLAAAHILGKPLGPYDFKAGLQSKCFRVLDQCGFEVVKKDAAAEVVVQARAVTPQSEGIEWRLVPGDQIKRTELHTQYGGRRQGGIAPSSQSRNVMLFTSKEGEAYGYIDGWQPHDWRFHYTGEGQRGDQQLTQGNKSVAEHVADGRALRLFNGSSGRVTYIGEFTLDLQQPHYYADSSTDEGARRLIVFRLVPVDEPGSLPLLSGLVSESVWLAPAERALCGTTELSEVESSTTPTFRQAIISETDAVRREAGLVKLYRANCPNKLMRLKIKAPGEVTYLYNDLYDETRNLLIEAKGTVTREAIRMAIGQLLDYRRFRPNQGPPRLAVLLPEVPRTDLRDLLFSCGIGVIAPTEEGSFKELWPAL